MEFEFKRPGVSGGIPFQKLMVDKLRQTRQEHPTLDFAAGNLPILGGAQAMMDMTDETASPVDRGMSALSFVPGGKILGKIAPSVQQKVADLLRKGKEVVLSPEEREAARKATNEAYAEQLLREERENLERYVAENSQK